MQETQETWVRSLDQEGSLEEGMATHSSILVWKIPWTEEPGRLQSTESQRVGHDRGTEHIYTQYLNDINGVKKHLLVEGHFNHKY